MRGMVSTRNAWPLLTLLLTLTLVACAGALPLPGSMAAELHKTWGPPTASYSLGGGGQRLEYASGPYGRTTWMVDLDANDRVLQTRQVLNEAEFFRLQSEPPMSADNLLRWIGTPGERRGARAGGQTWSWRYPTNDCLWFQVSLDAQGQTQGASFGIDPRCDGPNNARD